MSICCLARGLTKERLQIVEFTSQLLVTLLIDDQSLSQVLVVVCGGVPGPRQMLKLLCQRGNREQSLRVMFARGISSIDFANDEVDMCD